MNEFKRVVTPLGIFELEVCEDKLAKVDIVNFEIRGKPELVEGRGDIFTNWLIRYFNGEVVEHIKEDLKMTENKVINRILSELLEVKYGETTTYGSLALKVGTHPRVVGIAMAKNPLPIFIPCHRVLGKRSLGNYSLGGKEIKKWLLDFERSNLRKF
ncbi:MAG TPA: methylated-DNA--[protein]-cysteine S-methyltransferase [Geobacterales bacterium]|nr:methylated-DNA--[protein]-cysteine S-methyltransferase [Geobacterales bacterium]